MELVKGLVVTSRRGRDVTKAYAVVGIEEDRVLLADGDKRLLAAPKRKNVRHINPTGTVLPAGAIETDHKLKMALKAFSVSSGG